MRLCIYSVKFYCFKWFILLTYWRKPIKLLNYVFKNSNWSIFKLTAVYFVRPVQCQEVKVLTSAATRISELCGLHLSSLVFLSVFKSEILVSSVWSRLCWWRTNYWYSSSNYFNKSKWKNVSLEQVNKVIV